MDNLKDLTNKQENAEFKFKPGDHVRIIEYGFKFFVRKSLSNMVGVKGMEYLYEDDTFKVYDRMPGLVGKEGAVTDRYFYRGKARYELDGVEGGKDTLYDEEQLELVRK